MNSPVRNVSPRFDVARRGLDTHPARRCAAASTCACSMTSRRSRKSSCLVSWLAPCESKRTSWASSSTRAKSVLHGFVYCSQIPAKKGGQSRSYTPPHSPRPRCAEEAAAAGDVVVRKLATCARAGEGRNVLVADICVPRPGTVTRPGWSLVTLPLPRHGSPATRRDRKYASEARRRRRGRGR